MRESSWSMYNNLGCRKYLTRSEVDRFLISAKSFDDRTHAFCQIMAASGCRISEALSISNRNINIDAGFLTLQSLKKRGKTVYRNIPIDHPILENILKLVEARYAGSDRFWDWSRMTAYRRVCSVMSNAGITGPHATPKGLRHAFGVHAIHSGVPLNLVQRWLGHADMKTTAIYAAAFGPEERQIATRMWRARNEPRLDSLPGSAVTAPAAAADFSALIATHNCL